MQSQPSGRRHSSRSPYTATVSFAEPGSSPGHPQTYPTHSQIASNFSGGTHQQGLYTGGYPQSTSDSHRNNTPGGSDTGYGSNLYSQPGAYNATQPQAYDWNAAGNDEEHEYRPRGRPSAPASAAGSPTCRFPGCNRPTLFDRRVNEMREWCSEHMRAAIEGGYEKPCKACGHWPRRNGHKFCCGNICRHPGPPSQTTPNLTVGTHQQERQGRSDTGGGSNLYPHPGVQPHPGHPGGGYTATSAQPQGSNSTGYARGFYPHRA